MNMETLKYAGRILIRLKTYSLIGVLGLAVSLSGSIIILRYLHQELTVDHYLETLDRLCLLTVNYNGSRNLTSNIDWNHDPNFVDPLDHPAVERHSNIYLMPEGELSMDETCYAARVIAADSTFLQLLPRTLLSGTASLSAPSDILLSERLAKRLFGKEEALGRSLMFSGKMVTVAGVWKEPAFRSSLEFDAVVSVGLNQLWMGNGCSCISLVLLHPDCTPEEVNAVQRPMSLRAYQDVAVLYQLVPYHENYFTPAFCSHEGESMFPKGNRKNCHILVLVTCLLFFVGFFNYLNLYAVIMQKRSRELGVKKVFGAGRRSLFCQLYVENLLFVISALLIVAVIIELTPGLLARYLNVVVLPDATFDVWLGVGVLLLFPLMGSLFPYVRYVLAMPMVSMRSAKAGSRFPLSRSLFLGLQYMITIGLTLVSIYFARQLYTMLHADLGYHTADIIRCQLYPSQYEDGTLDSDEAWQQRSARRKAIAAEIIHQLNACPFIECWSRDADLWNMSPFGCVKKADTDQPYTQVACAFITTTDMHLYDLEIVEGRGWDDSQDSFTEYNLIINETAKRMLGITDIRTDQIQAQRRLWFSMDVDCSGNPPYRIVGVMKDFRTDHLSKGVAPAIFAYSGSFSERSDFEGRTLMIRTYPGKHQEAIQFLSDLRNKISGSGTLDYSFLEDDIAARYDNDRQLVYVYLTFALLAIAVSCLGLFGLSLFELRLRYREIAIRKVNGANTWQLMLLLVKHYATVLGVSALIAVPVAVFFIHYYTADYVEKEPLSFWMILLTLLLVCLLSAGVLFGQVKRAARINPAEVMKGE